jgi:hypothetical protein
VILGRVLPGAREIARHEAYHAAALCLAGLVPKCVRTDWPDQAAPGATDIDWGEGGYMNPAAAKSVLVLVLGDASGALRAGNGRPGRLTPRRWPREPAATRSWS